MATFEGVYNSILRGVSQQIPQEREDGQLSEQINMLSDPVTGLRRRSGFKFHTELTGAFEHSYYGIVDIYGTDYIMTIDPVTGFLRIYNLDGTMRKEVYVEYLKTTNGRSSLRHVVSRNTCYIVNTERVPTKALSGAPAVPNPNQRGYLSVRQGALGRWYNIKLQWGTFVKSFSIESNRTEAWGATPSYITGQFHEAMVADADVNAAFDLVLEENVLTITAKGTPTWEQLTVETADTESWMMVSGTSRVNQRTSLLGTLPSTLDNYIMAVGTLKNSSYYQYNKATNTWKEVGQWELPYFIANEPFIWTVDSNLPDPFVVNGLGIKMRGAGDDENNPLPEFINYGITGIGTYQSRLILLAGSYVLMSKTKDFREFSRTTVTELLDDDPISIASASLTSAQFEYAIPYNKDLVLISKTHQAVIPSNNTVLTPKTAVIYPSNEVDVSLAVAPRVVGRSLYYAYQRGSEYFQVGEFIPNSYTDAQYVSQSLMGHLPLYAKGVCYTMASSTTNNMALFCSGTNEVLVNQYIWQGDERVLSSFHKWVLPFNVVHMEFLQDTLYFIMINTLGKAVVCTNELQFNQLDDKPIPYLDMYRIETITGGTGTVDYDTIGMVASVYGIQGMRHMPTMYNRVGNTITCPYDGTITLGLPYTSTFSVTPPFIKDSNGKVLTGVKSTVHGLRMSFRATSTFHSHVEDAMGVSYDYERDTALTWSETSIGMATINNIGSAYIPCRTQMPSTVCTISTDSTTDMNIVSVEYVIRYQGKHRRL